MKSTVERAPGGRVVVHVEVPPEEMAPDIEQAYRRLARQVRIPGFRPGKAPLPLVERMVGRERARQEALGGLVARAYRAAVDEQRLVPVDQPQIDVQSFEDGQPLRFQATVSVRPEVALGDYRAIRVPREVAPVGPEDVERALEDLRQARGTWVPVEDAPAAEGDLVILRTTGTMDDGRPVDERRAEGVVGAGHLRPEVDQAVRGLRPGQAVETDVRLPATEPDRALAGRTAHVRVEVLEVKRKELPQLDDAFAREVGDGRTLEALRAELDRRLRAAAERQADAAVAEKAVAAAVDGARAEIPDVLIERGVDNLLRELERQLAAAGVTLTAHLAARGQTLEQLRAELRPAGERRVKSELVLEAVAAAEGLEPTDADVEQEIGRLAQASGQPVASFRRRARQPDVWSAVRFELLRRRTVAYLRALALGTPPEEAAALALHGDSAAADGSADPGGEEHVGEHEGDGVAAGGPAGGEGSA